MTSGKVFILCASISFSGQNKINHFIKLLQRLNELINVKCLVSGSKPEKCLWFDSVPKNLPANAGDRRDMSLTSGLGRYLGEGNGNPLQYSCLENPMDRGAWCATVHGVTKELVTIY